jgi:tRNA modification GTPase
MNAPAETQPPAETIAAISTAPGRGGVGVIRVSGPGVPLVIAGILREPLLPRLATRSTFRGTAGEAIDQGLAIHFPAPRSYTGVPIGRSPIT